MRCHSFLVTRLFHLYVPAKIISHFTKSLLKLFFSPSHHSLSFHFALRLLFANIRTMSTSKLETTDHLSCIKLYRISLVVTTIFYRLSVCSSSSFDTFYFKRITVASYNLPLIILIFRSFWMAAFIVTPAKTFVVSYSTKNSGIIALLCAFEIITFFPYPFEIRHLSFPFQR